jgi:S-adenosylmethionine hydrolase
MSRPVIALLTDFGLRDHYVGAMKGVILGICGDATLVDISHDIPPQDVLGGALELEASYRFFPAGTIFLVVVDPGVGSRRRGIAVAAGGYTFVAPDNGLLSSVLGAHPPKLIVELTGTQYRLPSVSRTFEGRDRFAPAAAWLARGVELAALGRAVHDVNRLEIPAAASDGSIISGEVLRIDRFGNLMTTIDRRLVDASASDRIQIRIGGRTITRVVASYAEAAPGELCAVFGSTDHLELAVNGGNAAALLELRRGAAVQLVLTA